MADYLHPSGKGKNTMSQEGYIVGRTSDGVKNKDRYMVGWNEDKKGAYKVGGGGQQVSQADNKALGSKGLDPVVGSKSQWDYKENPYADVGDRGSNSNMGGKVSDGAMADPTGTGGQVMLEYAEKGDWDASKDAIARRKEMMDAEKRYYSKNGQYDSPTVDLVELKNK